MKSPGEWFLAFAFAARGEGRTVDEKICSKVFEAVGEKDNPARQLSLYSQAREMAKAAGDRRLVLFATHWCAQCMMHEVRDWSQLLETVVPAVVEARQPQFSDLPQRFCLQEDLVSAYMSKDPLGHSEAIEEALDYFEREVPRDLSCRYCYLHLRTGFELVKRNVSAAWESEVTAIAEISGDSDSPSVRNHHLMVGYNKLCSIAALRSDWETVVDNAVAGLPYAEELDDSQRIATYQVWRAVGLMGLKEEDDAQRQFRSARRRRLKKPPSSYYYDAVSLYHELSGRPHLAWKAREQEFDEMAGQGRHWDECECRLKRCRLAMQMSKPDLLQAEADALRETAAQLKFPQSITDKLDNLLNEA